jgi:hypothetical protein
MMPSLPSALIVWSLSPVQTVLAEVHLDLGTLHIDNVYNMCSVLFPQPFGSQRHRLGPPGQEHRAFLRCGTVNAS